MKKNLFIFTFCLLISGLAMSQGLQFSRVLLVEATQQSVPAGKVWKVESVMPSTSYGRASASYYTLPSPTLANDYVIIINSNNVFLGDATAGVTSGYTGGSNAASEIFLGVNASLFPMWLPENTTLAASNNIKYISVIEFTIVP